MKGDIMIGTGMTIFAVAACGLDSPGFYGYIAAAACLAGEAVTATGYWINCKRRTEMENKVHGGYFHEKSEKSEKLTGPGWEEISTGVFIPEESAYQYAIERIISGTKEEKSDFTEWFYSGNYIRR